MILLAKSSYANKTRLNQYQKMTTTIFVNMLAFATLLSSVFSITSKNPVISVIFLISTFVSGAGYLILIGINFVGISYIIVYVGAIAVLFLFVIMMINIKLTDILETGSQYTKNLPLAIAIGSLFIFIIFSIIPFNFNNVPAVSIFLDKITYLNTILTGSSISSNVLSQNVVSIDLINTIVNNNNLAPIFTTQSSDVIINDFQQIEALGYSLYTYGAVLLITLSVILLLAMYATIVISSPTIHKNSPIDSSNLRPKASMLKVVAHATSRDSFASRSASPLACGAKQVTKVKKPGLKAWFTDLKEALKDGFKMPLYPEHIIKFNNNIYVIILRNIGAICFFIYMCSKKIDFGFNPILYKIIWGVSILYMIYRLILVFYSFKQTYHYIVTGKYLVRNSPLNFTWTYMRIVSGALKNTTGFVFGTGLAFSLGHEMDAILVSNDYQAYFIPNLQKTIKATGLEPAMHSIFDRLGIQKNVPLDSPNQPRTNIDIANLTPEQKFELEEKLGVKHESLIKFVEQLRSPNKTSVSQEIQADIIKNDPFKNNKDK